MEDDLVVEIPLERLAPNMPQVYTIPLQDLHYNQ
jgi:hypothetical protein